MIGYPAEIKAKISGKTFEEAIIRLDEQQGAMNYTLNQRIVYFADTEALEIHNSNKVLIRFRWNNEILESVIKIRHSPLHDIKKIRDEYKNLENHILKIDGDVVTDKEMQWSLSLKFRFPNINPAFSFFTKPSDYLTPLQIKLLKKLAPKVNLTHLKYGIPIESRAYTFDTDFKEFSSITLEEWRLPRLLGDKLHEISIKTETYEEKCRRHFIELVDDLQIDISGESLFKTERYYRSYFNI